ncbi:MAG: hypothetical protein PHW76_10380, partial [Alphaproteobacteria bacterium]|nr:hypothetical protein [Alphaproteobacteria bacterium]
MKNLRLHLLYGASILAQCCVFAGMPAAAADTTWTSTTSTDWFSAGNRSGGVPVGTSTAIINMGSTGPIINAAGALSSYVEVGTTATGGMLT